MKPRWLYLLLVVFTIHGITWLFWGESTLVRKHLEDSKTNSFCVENHNGWIKSRGNTIPFYTATYLEKDVETTFKDTLYTIYRDSFDYSVIIDKSDSLNIAYGYHFYNGLPNPYFFYNEVGCMEHWWARGTGNDSPGYISVWFFYRWINVYESGDLYSQLYDSPFSFVLE
ncbi:MAG: hypothetical protein RIE52_07285 [Balneola sp.]|jgi:hypothetical protein